MQYSLFKEELCFEITSEEYRKAPGKQTSIWRSDMAVPMPLMIILNHITIDLPQ